MNLKSEQKEQEIVARYIDEKYPNVLWSASCGGMRTSIGTAVKMKRAGYKKGCPDIMIFEPREFYCGLFIELKCEKSIYTPKGKATPEQLHFLSELSNRKYFSVLCYGAQDAIRILDDYLKGAK